LGASAHRDKFCFYRNTTRDFDVKQRLERLQLFWFLYSEAREQLAQRVLPGDKFNGGFRTKRCGAARVNTEREESRPGRRPMIA